MLTFTTARDNAVNIPKDPKETLQRLTTLENKLSGDSNIITENERDLIDLVFESVFAGLVENVTERGHDIGYLDLALDPAIVKLIQEHQRHTRESVDHIFRSLHIQYNLDKLFNGGHESSFTIYSTEHYPQKMRLVIVFDNFSLNGLRADIKRRKELIEAKEARDQQNKMAEQINAISGWVDTIAKIRTTVEVIELHTTDIITSLKSITDKLSKFNPLKKKEPKPKI